MSGGIAMLWSLRERRSPLLFISGFLLFAAGLLIATFLDQYTKKLAVDHLMGKSPIVLIPGVFELRYVENRGAAFGMLQGGRILFFILTAVVLVGILYILKIIPMTKRFLPLALTLSLLFYGAVGNLIDRTLNGFVVDFLYFSLIDFPVFNVADIYVTVSAFLLMYLFFFFYQENELSFIVFPGLRAGSEKERK